MGFKDFFEGAWEITKAVGELGAGLTKVGVEGVAELGEICTDGFKEMVVKGNNDYKTSYEIKDKAEDIMTSAQSRWNSAECKLKKRIEETKNNIDKSYEYKRLLLVRIGDNLGKQHILTNSTEAIRLSTPYCVGFEKNFEFFISTNIGILGIGFRKTMANEYLNDARDYSREVSEKIAKLNCIIVLLENIDNQIMEETKLIKILERAMNEQRKINYNNAYEIIKDMLKNEISNESGSVSSKYIRDFERFKSLCSTI